MKNTTRSISGLCRGVIKPAKTLVRKIERTFQRNDTAAGCHLVESTLGHHRQFWNWEVIRHDSGNHIPREWKTEIALLASG